MQTESAAPSVDDDVVARPRLDMFTYKGPTDLYAALARVRDRAHAHDAHAWLVIERYVRRALPLDRDEDIRQNAMLAIVVHAPTLVARDPGGARAWVSAVCRSQLVNELRGRYRMRLVSLDDGHWHDRLVAPWSPRPELAEHVLFALHELVVRHVRECVRDRSVRARKIAQARAVIRRLVLEEALPELADLTPGSVVLITKWIERGRKVVLDAIDAERARDPDGADLFEPVAALMRRRRADAGKPRPARRTRTN